MRLVAVTRILNEDDIVEAFVRHHAPMVDHHLLLDNGSVDRTLDILRSLRAEGMNLTVFQNEAPSFAEVKYNTNLFVQARRMFSADWVLFLDADEFIDTRETPDGLRPRMAALPDDVHCLAVPTINYLDLPDDDPAELLVPLRLKRRERVAQHPVAKVFVRGQLAEAGATIEAGQHQVLRNGETVIGFAEHGLTLAHYYRRSAWQMVSKSLLGHLKVAAAGQRERAKGRGSHYDEMFKSLRDAPDRLLRDQGFLRPTYGWLDVVDDPLLYLGGPLRYTQPQDPLFKAVRVLVAYAEQLAEQHGALIDTNEGIQLQTERAAGMWRHLL